MPHDSTAQAARERADGLMTGFPPAPEAQVTLANWQDPPYNRWAFRHMREVIPSQPIPAGSAGYGGAGGLPAAPWPLPDPPVQPYPFADARDALRAIAHRQARGKVVLTRIALS